MKPELIAIVALACMLPLTESCVTEDAHHKDILLPMSVSIVKDTECSMDMDDADRFLKRLALVDSSESALANAAALPTFDVHDLFNAIACAASNSSADVFADTADTAAVVALLRVDAPAVVAVIKRLSELGMLEKIEDKPVSGETIGVWGVTLVLEQWRLSHGSPSEAFVCAQNPTATPIKSSCDLLSAFAQEVGAPEETLSDGLIKQLRVFSGTVAEAKGDGFVTVDREFHFSKGVSAAFMAIATLANAQKNAPKKLKADDIDNLIVAAAKQKK